MPRENGAIARLGIEISGAGVPCLLEHKLEQQHSLAFKLLATLALALLWGCSAEPHSIVGRWNIREIPNDTWTFSNDGKITITADSAPYDNGSYTLTNQALRIRISTEKTPPYAITWLDADKFYLSADHVELTLYRLLY
jgi:hypothetical protein